MRETSSAALSGAEKRERAVALTLDGLNQRQIGEVLGVSKQQVNQYLKKAFRDYNKGTLSKVPALRAREQARFDRLSARLVPFFEDVEVVDEKTGEVTKKTNPKFHWAWERDLELGRQRRGMLGLDSATKHEVVEHSGGPSKPRSDIAKLDDESLHNRMLDLLKG